MPWQKGQSGNPAGRSKAMAEHAEKVRLLACAYTKEAIETLVFVMQKGEPHTARVAAADKIIDRACGKAPQSHTDAEGNEAIQITIRHLLGDDSEGR
jgi:hypothetical protein